MTSSALADVWRPAARIRGLRPSAVATVLQRSTDPAIIPLAAGGPDPALFPAEEVARITSDLLALHPANSLQYGATSGDRELRAWVAERHTARGGLPRGAEHVVATHGSQQGLDLVCKALLDPGDLVVVDRPSYVGALQVFALYGAEVRALPLADDPGLDDLADLARRSLLNGSPVRLVYVVPDHANPTGRSLGAAHRCALAELAERYGFLIVEDAPYTDLTWAGVRPGPPLGALTERVVTLTSFSKTLFPGARLGHLTAPPPLAEVFHLLKQGADLGNSALLQRIALTLVREPCFWERQLGRAREVYRERCGLLTAALASHGGGGPLRFTPPEGGFFLWARVPGDGPSADALLPRALAEGVSYIPGSAFYAGAEPDVHALRLSYADAPAGDLPEAAARLHRAYRALAAC